MPSPDESSSSSSSSETHEELPVDMLSAFNNGQHLNDLYRRVFIVTDPTKPDNPIIDVDPLFAAWLGYEPKDILGKNCRFLQGSTPDAHAKRIVDEIIKSKKPGKVSVKNFRANGQAFMNTFEIEPYYDEKGKPVLFIGRHLAVNVLYQEHCASTTPL